MPRYLYRVTYTHSDDTVSHEPMALDADTEAEALVEVLAATARYPAAVGATRTAELVSTTP